MDALTAKHVDAATKRLQDKGYTPDEIDAILDVDHIEEDCGFWDD